MWILSKISDRTKQGMVGVLLITLCFLTFLSLVSYNSQDFTSLSRISGWSAFWSGYSSAVTNQGGIVGALISAGLYFILGYCALLIPIFFIFTGIRLLFNVRFGIVLSKLRYLLAVLFVLGTLLAISPAGKGMKFSGESVTLAGYSGHLLAVIMNSIIGKTGAIVVCISLLILSGWALSPFNFSSFKNLRKPKLKPQEDAPAPKFAFLKKLFRRKKSPALIHAEPTGETNSAREVPRQSPIFATPGKDEDFDYVPGRKMSAPAATRAPRGEIRAGDGRFDFPALSLLNDPPAGKVKISPEELNQTARILKETLATFGVGVEGEIEVFPGPVITRFEFKPASGIKVNQVVSLADDLALAMQAKRIRIVAPIPGKAAIGVEIPNRQPETVYIKEILTSSYFRDNNFRLPLALGKDISGQPCVADLAKMPHLLIAGATGSGKSVCLNSVITSLLYRLHPDEVRFVMIDPKMLELSVYSGIPHLEKPVVVSHKVAERILGDAVIEMEERYKRLARASVRNIEDYNAKGDELLPYLIIIVDELADLIMSGSNKSEAQITRLAQMARAVGIHLILATQRPSVDVITGLIKANFSSRIAFQVASKIDSRTILDANGAEKLLGSGDMLFLQAGLPEPVRVHGSLVAGTETERIVTYLKDQNYMPAPIEIFSGEETLERGMSKDFDDDLLREAAELVVRHKQGSVSLLQRRLGIGYQRAGRLIDILETKGIVGPYDGSKARQVLVDQKGLEEKIPNPTT